MEVKWIKLSTDLFNNRKIRQIERMDDGDAIIVIWLKLLILAGEINDGGEIYFTKEVPFTEESLAVQFDRPRELIALALRTFQAFGMIEIDDDALSIRNWEKYQNIEGMEKIREQNRKRQKVWYDNHKKKDNLTLDLTSPNGIDKKRIDKNREDIIHTSPLDLSKMLADKWQIDGDEANKEIRQ